MSRGRKALPPAGEELDELDGPAAVTPGDWIALAAGAVRRRKLVTLLVFAASVAAVVLFYRSRTPYYRVETKILAQRQYAVPSVVRAPYDDQPGRTAWETIHRRENLLALIQRANMLGTDDAALPAPEEPGKPLGPDERVNALVAFLDKRLVVETDEGTIRISLDWPDPQVAYDVVQGALQNFLEARHVQEITAIDEVISVLQGRAASLREALDVAMEDARRRAARPPRPPPARVRAPSEDLVRARSLLEARQRAIRDMEELRLRRIADLQTQLDQARNTLSDAHPTVIGLRKDLEAASRESPQLQALREEERKLAKDYSDRLAREGLSGSAAATVGQPPAPTEPAANPEEDPLVRQARAEYEQMVARVTSAQVELDGARAAFKYRYNVIWPPQRPTDPVSPNPQKILGLGLLASFLLAFAAALAPDVLAGRIVERWQVERSLGVPVLGEVRRRT
jgi:hypothetical protein